MFDVSFIKDVVSNKCYNVKTKIFLLLLEEVTDTAQNCQGNFLLSQCHSLFLCRSKSVPLVACRTCFVQLQLPTKTETSSEDQ